MKTISELNEKWYFRLISVIFIMGCIFGIIFSFILPFGYIGSQVTYNPGSISNNISILENIKNEKDLLKTPIFKKILDELPKQSYSRKEISKFFSENNILDGETAYLYLQALLVLNKDIEGLGYDKERCMIDCGAGNEWIKTLYIDNWTCKEDFIDERGVMNYCNDYEYWAMLPAKSIIEMKQYINDVPRVLNLIIEKIRKDDVRYLYLSYEEEKLLEHFNIRLDFGEKNYIPPVAYLYGVGIFLASVIIVILSVFLIRGVFYFIVLGKFFPEK